jgi:hypothetical protein
VEPSKMSAAQKRKAKKAERTAVVKEKRVKLSLIL